MVTWIPNQKDYKESLDFLKNQKINHNAPYHNTKKGKGYVVGDYDEIMSHWKEDNSGPLGAISKRTMEYKIDNPDKQDRKAFSLREKQGSESIDISNMVTSSQIETKSGTILHIYNDSNTDYSMDPIVFFHGGAFVGGSPEVPENALKHLCQLSNRLIINVDYVLAPEKKGYWAISECYSTIQYVITSDLTKSNHVIIAGDSAGGNITAALSYLDRIIYKNSYVDKQILLYPDLALDPSLFNDIKWDIKKYKITNINIYNDLLDQLNNSQELSKFIEEIYVGGEESSQPCFSPLNMTDQMFAQLPPTFLTVAEFDILRPHGILYAEHLKDVGNEVKMITYLGMEHAYMDKYGILPQGEDTNAEIIDWLST